MAVHHRERAVLIPLRRVNGEPCLTDQLLQCLAFLEADVFDVLNTIYCLFQRASTGENELHIRQFLTDLDECADALLLREAAKVEDVILFLRFFPLHLVDEVVHCHGLGRKQRIADPPLGYKNFLYYSFLRQNTICRYKIIINHHI